MFGRIQSRYSPFAADQRRAAKREWGLLSAGDLVNKNV